MSLFTTTPLPTLGAPDRRASLGETAVEGFGSSYNTDITQVVQYARRVDANIQQLDGEYTGAFATPLPTPTGSYSADLKAYEEWKSKQPKILQDWRAFKDRWGVFKAENFELNSDSSIKGAGWSRWFFPPTLRIFDEVAAFDVENDRWVALYKERTGKKISAPSAAVSAAEIEAKAKAVQGAGANPFAALYEFITNVAILAVVGVAAWYLVPVVVTAMKKRSDAKALEASPTLASPPPALPQGPEPALAGAVYGDRVYDDPNW